MTNTQNTFEALKFIVTSKEQLKYLLMKLKNAGYDDKHKLEDVYCKSFRGIYAHDNGVITWFGVNDNFASYDADCKLADADAYITGGGIHY